MNLFGSLPQEKAMQSLIHDTNSALSQLRHSIKGMTESFKKNQVTDSRLYIQLEYIKSCERDIVKALDVYYKKFSADFHDSITPSPEDKP